jgi:hypothetical protein
MMKYQIKHSKTGKFVTEIRYHKPIFEDWARGFSRSFAYQCVKDWNATNVEKLVHEPFQENLK